MECDMNEFGIEWIGTNDKGGPTHGEWRNKKMSQWMMGMVKGYKGPNDMVSENVEPRTMFQRSPNAPYQGLENGTKCGGKGCMKMDRWSEGYCMEDVKACVLLKHV